MQREEINYLAQLVQKDELKKLYEKIRTKYTIKILSKPIEQTLLVPIIDPISGGEFYAGEVLVTSSVVELEETKGWSMIQDSDEKLSLYTAVLDAAFEAKIFQNEIKELLEKAKKEKQKENQKINQKINATKVVFDLMN